MECRPGNITPLNYKYVNTKVIHCVCMYPPFNRVPFLAVYFVELPIWQTKFSCYKSYRDELYLTVVGPDSSISKAFAIYSRYLGFPLPIYEYLALSWKFFYSYDVKLVLKHLTLNVFE